jgi:hypothetical protein
MPTPLDPDRQCIAAFFGDDIAVAWSAERPHPLLGLVTAEYPASVVHATLAKRTAFVNLHPLRATAQAERVRLLLREGAERLLAGGDAMASVSARAASVPSDSVALAEGPAHEAHDAKAGGEASLAPQAPPGEPASPALGANDQANGPAPLARMPLPAPAQPAASPATPISRSPAKPVEVVIPLAEPDVPAAISNAVARSPVPPPAPQPAPPPAPAATPAIDLLVRFAAHAVANGEPAGPILLSKMVHVAAGLGQPPALAEQALRVFVQQGLTPTGPEVSTASPGGTNGQTTNAVGFGSVERRMASPAAAGVGASTAARGPWLGAAVGVATIVVLLIIGAIWFSSLLAGADEPTPGAPPTPVVAADTGPAVTPVAPSSGPSARAVTDAVNTTVDAGEVRRQVRTAARLITDGDRAAGLRTLAAAARAAGTSWLGHTPPERLVIVNEIIDAMLLLPPDRTTLAAIDLVSVTGGPLSAPGVLSEAWTAGALARLSREREAPPGLLTPAVERLIELTGRAAGPGGAVWPAGAAQALAGMPPRLIQGQSPVAAAAAALAWEQAVRAIWSVQSGLPEAGSDVAQAARMAETVLLDGIERLLVSGPEPSDDRAMYDTLFAFAARQRWRAEDGSRERMLRWLGDERVSAADLHVLTSALVGRSSAEGVDMSMVLAAGADATARQGVRAAFAQAWGLERQAGAQANRGRMYQRLDEAVARTAGVDGPDADLRAVLQFAMVNRVGAGAITGIDPGDVIDAATLPSNLAQFRMIEGVGPTGDGEWAARFLSERSTALRLERLRELENRGPPLGPVDAEVLVETAVLGTAEVRTSAERLLQRFGGEWTVVSGLLEILPRAPRRRSLVDAISLVTQRPLIGVPPERWMYESRKALVERSLELLSASQADIGQVDQHVVMLAEHYRAMAGTASAAAPLESEASDALLDAAAALASTLRRQAEQLVPSREAPLRLDEVQARFQARMAAAVGPIQRFACHQLMIAETAAYIASITRPAAAPRVAEVLADMTAARRRATHIFGQLRAVERAIAELWAIAAEGSRT